MCIYLILSLKWPNMATLVLMRDDLVHPLEFVPNVLFYKMELYPKTVKYSLFWSVFLPWASSILSKVLKCSWKNTLKILTGQDVTIWAFTKKESVNNKCLLNLIQIQHNACFNTDWADSLDYMLPHQVILRHYQYCSYHHCASYYFSIIFVLCFYYCISRNNNALRKLANTLVTTC